MSVPSACPHCQRTLPDGFIGKACPHCRGALTGKRKRSLSGFSFPAMQPGAPGSSRPPLAPHSSAPPREVVEDRWDLPDLGVEGMRERGAVPPAAPTGFPAVPAPMTARQLRSTMAIGVADGAPAPAPPPATPPPPATSALDPLAWNLDHAPASPSGRSGPLDVRALKQTALGVSPAAAAAAAAAPVARWAEVTRERGTDVGSIRRTALGVAPAAPATPVPAAPSPGFDVDDFPEADAFPLVRSSHPSPAASTRPPPREALGASADEIQIHSAPAAAQGPELLEAYDEGAAASLQASYAPLRAPPSRRPGPVAPIAWWWSVAGAVLLLSAVAVLRSAPLAVALRVAAAVASLLMVARLGGLAMRALLVLLVALPALAQEALSIAALSRAGAGVLTAALVLLPAGAWTSAERLRTRRALLVAGVALTLGAALMPGGVALPWSLGAAPALALALVALLSPARWASVALTAALMAWAAACGASGGVASPSAAASGLAAGALVLLCGRALAAVVEGDE